MLIMINTFMSQSSAFGGEILAANSILMQIQYVMGDIFTGFSQAAAIYAGIAAGEGNKKLLQSTFKISGWQQPFCRLAFTLCGALKLPGFLPACRKFLLP